MCRSDSELIDDVVATPANTHDADARDDLQQAGFDVIAKVRPAGGRADMFGKDDFATPKPRSVSSSRSRTSFRRTSRPSGCEAGRVLSGRSTRWRSLPLLIMPLITCQGEPEVTDLCR